MLSKTNYPNAQVHHLSVAQLVQLYQKDHQPLILSELYKRFFDRVYRYCLNLCKDQEVALDLTQDVFLKIAEHLDELRNPELFPAWLFRIAHNRFINYVKSTALASHFAALATEERDDPEERELALEREHLLDRMQGLLEQMPPMDRELLLARYFHKESIQLLEARYGLSESAIKMRLSRARQRMARLCC